MAGLFFEAAMANVDEQLCEACRSNRELKKKYRALPPAPRAVVGRRDDECLSCSVSNYTTRRRGVRVSYNMR